MRTAILSALLIITTLFSSAQYYTNQNKNWVFGLHAGLNFNSGAPVPFSAAMTQNEGCASVSDVAGNLLFYTDGKVVYNRVGSIMPSGAAIVPWGTYSTTQAAVIVPVLSGSGRYYIFTLEEDGLVSASRLSYSIVDMSLAGGMGDVVSSSMCIRMDSMLSEKMIAVQGNNCNIWLLTCRRDSRQFLVYNITPAGISAPVISAFTVPGYYRNVIGSMVCSPNRQTIAMQYSLTVSAGVELYSFNHISGVVSNRRLLDSGRMHYSAEFSPDNTRLYTMQYNNSTPSLIEQYDLTLPSLPAIVGSRTVIKMGYTGATTQMKLAPDGKIYLMSFTDAFTDSLDVIPHPNVLGAGCGYVRHAVGLMPGTRGYLGLPAQYVTGGYNIVGSTTRDTTICVEAGDTINIYPNGTAAAYVWYDGDTGAYHRVTAQGTYWVQRITGCSAIIDTINVIPAYDTAYHTWDTTVCKHTDFDSFLLVAPPGTDYLWYNGSTDTSAVEHFAGNYWVMYTTGCTRNIDTFHVTVKYPPGPITGPDSVCKDNTIVLANATPGGVWSSGATGTASIGSSTGIVTGMSPGMAVITYKLIGDCEATKNVTVLAPPCITGISIPAMNDKDITLFPNPANGECTVSFTGNAYIGATISITDISGRYISTYTVKGAQTIISTSDFSPGVYQCRITINGSAPVVKKLVVAR